MNIGKMEKVYCMETTYGLVSRSIFALKILGGNALLQQVV